MRVVAGEARGRPLAVPPGGGTRAATDRVRESLFAVLEHYLEGTRVLDLFAGAGSLGIEALSRGALFATFVEQDARAAAVIRKNLASTGFTDRAEVVRSEVRAFLGGEAPSGYDFAFCDPPFAGVAMLGATLAHPGLRRILNERALVVARVLRKHPPAIPASARLERTMKIGEEDLLLLRYDADASVPNEMGE